MSKRKSRRARKQAKARQQRPAQHAQKAVDVASKQDAVIDRKIAKDKALHEEAKANAEVAVLLQRLCRDCNVQHLRDQIAVKVVQKDWRATVLGWREETPSQLGRLRNAVLRPVIKDQDWQKQFKAFIETLDPEKWAAASTDKLNQLAEPDSFWQAADIALPKGAEHETLFYWRRALTTLLLGALRAHSRERERANPGAEL